MFHVLGMVRKGVVYRRKQQARGSRYHKDGESNQIGSSDPRVSASKVLLYISLAEQEQKGRNEVGIYVDRLVVQIGQTAERIVNRA